MHVFVNIKLTAVCIYLRIDTLGWYGDEKPHTHSNEASVGMKLHINIV